MAVVSTVSRIACPHCSAECIEPEKTCWQCGKALQPELSRPVQEAMTEPAGKTAGASIRIFGRLIGKQPPPPEPTEPAKPLINFEPGASASEQPARRMAMTLTGELVEVEEAGASLEPATESSDSSIAANIGGSTIATGLTEQLFRLTWCKNCGYDNPEGVVECVKCKSILDVVTEADRPGEIEPLPRAIGFDMLGAVWIILGLVAIYCGQFLVKTDASRHSATWSDYFWTGIVASAPGILIVMRHYFCKLLFWVMTLSSALVWAVIFVVWITGHLYVSDNAQIGLEWLLALTMLSVISYVTVRQNDAFDYSS